MESTIRTADDLIFPQMTATKYDNINIDEELALGVGSSSSVFKSEMKINGKLQMVRFTTLTAECFIFAGGH